jgi:hypothetical protein
MQPKYCEPELSRNRQIMAQKSDRDVAWIASGISRWHYGGPCACPDDTDDAGEKCGGRSAYERSGGSSPICSASDVPPDLLPRVREDAARLALPIECGGLGYSEVLNF